MKTKTTHTPRIPACPFSTPPCRILLACTALAGVLPLQAQVLSETGETLTTSDAHPNDDVASVDALPIPVRLDAAALAEEIRLRRPAPREMPAAVKNARVLSQVVAPGAAGGAPLTVSLIEPPTLPVPAAHPRVVAAFTDEQRAAIRAAEPLLLLNFAPTIEVYPGGVSLVHWGMVDAEKGYQEFEAWVPLDLTSITIVGDLEVGRTRYSVMGFAYPATGSAPAREAPAAQALAGAYDLAKGDPANAAALEPLRALLAIYKQEGAQLAATHAALQARQQEVEQWERGNPEPPRPAEIRLWSMEPATAGAPSSPAAR